MKKAQDVEFIREAVDLFRCDAARGRGVEVYASFARRCWLRMVLFQAFRQQLDCPFMPLETPDGSNVVVNECGVRDDCFLLDNVSVVFVTAMLPSRARKLRDWVVAC